jgi:ubiquinone/menaquinone biosynthesis C-methylase UbiE
MPDVYATIEEADEAVQVQLADVLELRAADPQQRAMLEEYLADLPLPTGARLLEIGCGTGAVARVLAARPGVREVIGIDPSPVFVEGARLRAQDVPNLSFVTGDGRELPFDDGSFDAVVCHTSLCHIPGADRVLEEARRVIAPGGKLAVFDGDYATTTVALYERDPLQACVEAAMDALVHDRWFVRRLPALVRNAGFDLVRLRSHGYVETAEPHYMLTIVDRGADVLAAGGRLGTPVAESLKTEARRRADEGRFFGHIAYASLIARRGNS